MRWRRDTTNNQTETADYYPYGQEKPSATTNDREKFATYLRDPESGLDYADQRYHNPGWGRFLTVDVGPTSASNPTTWNRYAYTLGDPVNLTDQRGLAPVGVFDDFGIAGTIFISEYVEGENGLFEIVHALPAGLKHPGKGQSLKRWEQYAEEAGLSEECARGLVTAGYGPDAVERASQSESVLQEAAAQYGIDWKMLAAIGIYETGFRNLNEKDGHGNAVGVFQFADTSGVPADTASKLREAAFAAANLLSQNKSTIQSAFPDLSGRMLEWAMVASWNRGAGGVVSNLQNGHTPDYHTSPIYSNGVHTGRYRGGGTGQYGTDVLHLMDCFR